MNLLLLAIQEGDMLNRILLLGLGVSCLIFGGCAFHSTAKDWNMLVGEDGKPTYYKSTTKLAFNLLILVPFIGDISIDGLLEELTADVAAEGGNRVRIVQGDSENYWYGFPPFTWIVTPVVSTVAAEYHPKKETWDQDQKEIYTDKQESSGLNPMEW